MKDINHIVLDFEKKTQFVDNWSLAFIYESKKLNNISQSSYLKKTHFLNSINNKSLNNKKKGIINYTNKLSSVELHTNKDVDSYFEYISRVITISINTLRKKTNVYNVSNDSYKLSNINFLRKERLYTKLKYSRSPAYDIVSGGAAALLAGFIGFLVQEKYGFELVDSGDFYYLFMYLVFLTFSIRPLLTAISTKEKITTLFSLNFLFNFYQKLLYLFFKMFKY